MRCVLEIIEKDQEPFGSLLARLPACPVFPATLLSEGLAGYLR